MVEGEEVLIKIDNKIATIVLNRPAALNAINVRLRNRLISIIEEIETNRDVRVVIITGSGEKAFCVGADIKERREMSILEMRELRQTGKNIYNLIENLSKPVMAAINGYALGGGFEIALACDIRIASNNSRFGLPEVTLGVIPVGGGTQRLPRLIGSAKAKELIFTGLTIGAQEALEIGFVNQVVPMEKLMNSALEMAVKISNNPPIAIREAKRAINLALNTNLETGLAFEAEAYLNCYVTKDREEALSAFREKRPPSYGGE
jgi:enoyl-CoA hydratase